MTGAIESPSLVVPLRTAQNRWVLRSFCLTFTCTVAVTGVLVFSVSASAADTWQQGVEAFTPIAEAAWPDNPCAGHVAVTFAPVPPGELGHVHPDACAGTIAQGLECANALQRAGP